MKHQDLHLPLLCHSCWGKKYASSGNGLQSIRPSVQTFSWNNLLSPCRTCGQAQLESFPTEAVCHLTGGGSGLQQELRRPRGRPGSKVGTNGVEEIVHSWGKSLGSADGQT